MARYRRSSGRSKSRGRRSGGGRRRGAGGRYVRSGGGGGGSRSGSISGKTIAMIAGGAVLAYLAYQKFGGVHPAVAHAAAQQAAASNPNAAIDAFAAAGGETDFNSATNIGLPIPFNPGPGMQSGPLQM